MTGTLAPVLTAREAADRLHVSIRTLNRWQAQGRIAPSYTPTGQRRFTEAAVDALITDQPPGDDAPGGPPA